MNKQDDFGIWKYQKYFPYIKPRYRLSLNEGGTPFKKVDNIYFKCEFVNPTGSVKDRGFAFQISKIYQQGIKQAVISSSGNAAISASSYSMLAGIKLKIFVSPSISPGKLAYMSQKDIEVRVTKRPISDSFKFARQYKAYNLRQSMDPAAVVGYQTISFEICEFQKHIDAIFIPVSSGTMFVGISMGFDKLKKHPSLHLVQTEAVCPIGSQYDQHFKKVQKSLADAIVAKYTPRESEIKKIIDESRGFGWVVSDDEIINASKFLDQNDLLCSYEGASSLAALWKAQKKGYQYKNPLCMLTGKKYD